MAYLIRIKYPLSGFNYHVFDVNVANFNIIHLRVSVFSDIAIFVLKGDVKLQLTHNSNLSVSEQ